MALASLFGGLALANAGLGAVHGFAGPIGGMFNVPHGMVCAALLPHVMKANLAAMDDLSRLEEFGRITGGETAEDGINWLAGLCRDLQVPPLSALGIAKNDFLAIVEKSKNSSSMKGNPVELTELELTQVLREAL
jgi:alcohol dehydrogenase class IV